MFRSSMKDDIDFLDKYKAINPFSGERSNKWAEIAENFMIHVTEDDAGRGPFYSFLIYRQMTGGSCTGVHV